MIPAKSKDHEIACSSNAMRVMCSISYKDAPVHTINTLRTMGGIEAACKHAGTPTFHETTLVTIHRILSLRPSQKPADA
eukprot:scaffold3831_cov19-Tisochrysis_lutea.AAC.3